jgi:hypothetical protein
MKRWSTHRSSAQSRLGGERVFAAPFFVADCVGIAQGRPARPAVNDILMLLHKTLNAGMIRRQLHALTHGPPEIGPAPPSRLQSVLAKAHAMPLSIVPQVIFGADAAHARGAFRRPSAPTPPRSQRNPVATDDPFQDDVASEVEDADARPASTAGLSILAQALAAYSQN